jgi:hypothetical protein
MGSIAPIVLALMCAFGPARVQAATYYVATTGNDANSGASAAPWKTVAKAANAMVAGDTTYVRGGVYEESFINFHKSGTAANPIKLLRFPSESPIIDCIDRAKTHRIVIENPAGQKYPIGWISIEGFEIRNCYNGIKFISAHDLTIRGNWFHDNWPGAGAVYGNGTRILVDRNRINHNGDFVGCDTGATACKPGYHGMYMNGAAITITNNLIYDNMTFGIQMNGSSYPYDPDKHPGPEFTGADKWLIANNTIAYQKRAGGIVVWGNKATNSRIENNTFFENGRTLSAASAQGIHFLSPGTGHQIKNNLSFATGSGAMSFLASVAIEGVHYTQSGNIVNVSNPGFVNGGSNALPSSPNFMLTSQSPAINKGLNLYSLGVTKDFAGVARPQTGAFEIGAYEYGTSTLPPAFNFSLSNGGNKAVTRGGSVTNSLTASLVSGTAQAVSLSVSGLPSGVTRSFSPTSCTPNCSSTLTLSASTAAALGTASLTVTATGGGISQTSAFTLTVNALQTSTHSVTLGVAQAAPGAALTVTVNGGSGSATQWVAVYLATAPESAYSYKGNWKYLNGTQTAPTTAVPTPVQLTFAAPMDAGVYNLRFFANTGSGTRLALSPNLTVGSTTDLNGDGITNVTDIQIAVNKAAGATACGSGDVNKDGVCNVADVQLVVNRSLGL